MSNTECIIELKEIATGYNGRQVLRDINVSLPQGQITGLVGPNGSGKSTLLNVVAGIRPAWSGTLWYQGRVITHDPAYVRSRNGIGLLLPGGQVFPSMTVSENMAIATSLARTRVSSAATDLDASHLFPELDQWRNKPAKLLSGGQRQMLAISLLLVQQPRVLLLDEPIEGLSQDKAAIIMEALKGFARRTGVTVLLVEHNTTFILQFCTVIHFMHEGTISHTLDTASADTEDRLVELFLQR